MSPRTRAAEWLEGTGNVDLGHIAHHFELGGDLDRAAELYARATQQALGNFGQMEAALELAQRVWLAVVERLHGTWLARVRDDLFVAELLNDLIVAILAVDGIAEHLVALFLFATLLFLL